MVCEIFFFSEIVRQEAKQVSLIDLCLGCSLSPILFNLMASDIARELEQVDDSVKLGNSRLNSLFYADDIVVAASTTDKLQEKINIINEVGGSFGMKISGKKSKRMVYGQVEVIVEDKDEHEIFEMEEVETFKYLGTKINISVCL